MKSEFKTKLIQHMLNKKNGEKGFTLIELLVVIIIIGILAAIALPSFLNQANKARQSEAKTYVGSLNRGQQAYFLENTNTFATDIPSLGLGIKTQSSNYTYATGGGTSSVSSGTPEASVANTLAGYAGLVWVTTTGEKTTLAGLCENVTTASIGTSGTNIACGTGKEIK